PALGTGWRQGQRRRFPDVAPGHLSYPAVSLVVEAGVMTPAGDGSFELARLATGAETAAAISKLEELARSRSR
ncbi:MAG: S-layer homology domain-containing protein, partial [Vicinamibacterales bacterium]